MIYFKRHSVFSPRSENLIQKQTREMLREIRRKVKIERGTLQRRCGYEVDIQLRRITQRSHPQYKLVVHSGRPNRVSIKYEFGFNTVGVLLKESRSKQIKGVSLAIVVTSRVQSLTIEEKKGGEKLRKSSFQTT